MIETHEEEVGSDFNGTIIDIETIGNFCNEFNDSRRYKDHIPVIFGFINNSKLVVHCAKSKDFIEKLKQEIIGLLDKLEKPFYAFNCDFERGVFFHRLGKKVVFEGELNKKKYEKKRDVVSERNIPNYDDPFKDDGSLCIRAWLNGQLKQSIAHNRSCLLKERDILLKRRSRKPDELKFVEC